MFEIQYTGDALWARVGRAVDKVQDRLQRVSQALNDANVPYAVVGGNAVQFWVAQVDESVVRNTRDVDIILNQHDLEQAKAVLAKVGFRYRHAARVSMFLDGPDAKARDAVLAVFAGEKVRNEYVEPVPAIDTCEEIKGSRTLPLEALVRMKLLEIVDDCFGQQVASLAVFHVTDVGTRRLGNSQVALRTFFGGETDDGWRV